MSCDDEMRGDLRAAVQQLAASNARLCDIGLAADKLAKAAEALVQDAHKSLYTNLREALEAYQIVRSGS